jgi:hypothetical protein
LAQTTAKELLLPEQFARYTSRMTYCDTNVRRHALRNQALLLGGLVGILCAGCWEEIRYDPTKTPVPVVETAPSEQVAEPAADTQADAPQVSTDALFGDQTEIPNDSEVSETDAAPLEEPSADLSAPSESNESLLAHTPTTEEAPTNEEGQDSFPPETTAVPPEVIPEVMPEEAIPMEAEPEEIEVLRPSRTALSTWRMSSRWSLAAAIYAKGQPEDRYRDLLEQATYAAELVNVEMPVFPASESGDQQATMIRYLLDTASMEIADKLGPEFPPEYASLAELAIKTHVLLLVYTPKSEQLEPLVIAIRQAAENSGLPRELWGGLAGMLERRESFADVKQQVLTLHTAVGDYLAGGGE